MYNSRIQGTKKKKLNSFKIQFMVGVWNKLQISLTLDQPRV